jgi:tetratricopeptide (TPR) repeat protein
MWQTVVDRRPNGRAYSNLAMELQKAGRTSEIVPLLRLAVRDLPDAEYDLGAQLYLNGQNEEAIDHLTAFLRLRAAHPKAAGARTLLVRAWTNVGIDRARRGDAAGAVQAFTQAAALDPSSADVHRNLANALLDNGDRAGAAEQAREALRLRPGDAVVQQILDEATRRAVDQQP